MLECVYGETIQTDKEETREDTPGTLHTLILQELVAENVRTHDILKLSNANSRRNKWGHGASWTLTPGAWAGTVGLVEPTSSHFAICQCTAELLTALHHWNGMDSWGRCLCVERGWLPGTFNLLLSNLRPCCRDSTSTSWIDPPSCSTMVHLIVILRSNR